MLGVSMVSVVMLSVIMLCVVVQNVVAPNGTAHFKTTECTSGKANKVTILKKEIKRIRDFYQTFLNDKILKTINYCKKW